MTVQITPKSTQHTGMALSTEGSVAAWQVTFELEGDDCADSDECGQPFRLKAASDSD